MGLHTQMYKVIQMYGMCVNYIQNRREMSCNKRMKVFLGNPQDGARKDLTLTLETFQIYRRQRAGQPDGQEVEGHELLTL